MSSDFNSADPRTLSKQALLLRLAERERLLGALRTVACESPDEVIGQIVRGLLSGQLRAKFEQTLVPGQFRLTIEGTAPAIRPNPQNVDAAPPQRDCVVSTSVVVGENTKPLEHA
jgi:hypothetical protein